MQLPGAAGLIAEHGHVCVVIPGSQGGRAEGQPHVFADWGANLGPSCHAGLILHQAIVSLGFAADRIRSSYGSNDDRLIAVKGP
jgi:hypothetical protein